MTIVRHAHTDAVVAIASDGTVHTFGRPRLLRGAEADDFIAGATVIPR